MDSVNISDQGRISQQAATGSTIALFILAVLVASFRTFVRWHYGKLSWLDDGFLALAVVLMVVSMGLWFTMMDNLYKTEALIYDPFGSALLFNNIIQIAIDVQIYTSTYIAISITAIFAIKFSFLFFFRSLISRLRPMVIYWRIVVAYTAIVWAISVGISFVACPYFDSRAVQCAQNQMLARALNVSIALLVFDVTSDALIISIPALVITRVRIHWRSKTYLFSSFCLSVVMIVCAILQGATLTTEGADAIDVVWQIYFQMVEVCLAVTVVSLTAFRTFFVQRGSRSNTPRSPGNKKWYSYKKWKKSVSDRTTSTGFTGFSEEMPLPLTQTRVEASVPEPSRDTSTPQETKPVDDLKSPISSSNTKKDPFPYPAEASASTDPPRSIPMAPEIRIPISPQLFNYEPPAPPPPPTPGSDDSENVSPNDINIPIQGPEDSPSSLTPIHTPLPTPAALTRDPSYQNSHLQPMDPDPRPHLVSAHSHTSASLSASAAVTEWSPPTLKPARSSSPVRRTALMGPSSAHTSRTDSLPHQATRIASGSNAPVPILSEVEPEGKSETERIPDVPPLPSPLPSAYLPQQQIQNQSQAPQPPDLKSPPSQPSIPPQPLASADLARGVPARKPLPPSPPTTTSIRSPPATASSSAAPNTPGTVTSPYIHSQIQSAQLARGLRPHGSKPSLTSIPPPPPVPATPTSVGMASAGTSVTSPITPRTPRSNLSPDLRISGVQRAIKSGIERAMSFEPASGGRGERW